MKQLELELQKTLLIVEVPRLADYEFINKDSKYLKVGNEEIKLNIPTLAKIDLICKGDELSEEIAKGLVKNGISDYLVERSYDYKNEVQLNLDTFSCLESFISAIESNGYYWGENPLGKEPQITEDKYKSEREFMDNNPGESVFGDHYADWLMWFEAESKTFNPEKTLIFEILL